ncbi:hypothetical protein ISF_05223 [Cordyceps fumosorosea ARSEF 2679]|uniref:Uncharacterized protein n=1 Tax=Cordyceps fumosorosea (strain ARSEF 2679) TaxID=1081104 RepID=A0A167V4E7_CORFA|nr:hypothetical protein ISF_05223 [Cordyceps fumosorosea ARSEF 2679]OAA62214.1 hypothetical protein ISF_05223 [Cordyceps fumosorosea ARSEF 2679]
MTLKRKRSSPEFPSSPLSFSSASSSPSNGPSTVDFTPRMGLINPCHLNSRTLKRLRNGRPSQEEIHQRTLELLYTAQHQQPYQDPPSPCPNVEAPPEPELPQNSHDNNQQSLHRFWNIKSRPTAAPDRTIEPMHMDES